MSYIESPNLPTQGVKVVLISSGAGNEVIKSLDMMGIEALIVPPCTDIAQPVSTHPDMLFHHLGGRHMVINNNADDKICRRLKELGFNLTQSNAKLEQQYPHDISLNAARVGNHLFCNEQYTDKTILDYCKMNQIHIISVKQGYAKCSICVADENTIITSDKSIETAAKHCGINVLLIREGFINLLGYDSGFIGGCCGKLSSDTMFFCGDINVHPDYSAIKSFLVMRGIEIIMLGDNKLCDIGSIIPIIQSD